MRLYIFLLIILIVQSSIALSQQTKVRIDGQIIGYDGTKIINYSIAPTHGSGNNGVVLPDSLGRFTIMKSIQETEFFYMYYSDNEVTHTCKLILKPGDHYSFISKGQESNKWDAHYSPDIYKWERNSDERLNFFTMDFGHIYYNLIDNGTGGSLYHDDWNLYQPDVLIEQLQSKIRAQDSVFQNLLIEGFIDKEFYEIAKLNIEYTQAYRLAQTIYDTWQQPKRFGIEDSVITKKLYEIYPTIFKLYPVRGVKIEYHFCFDRYVDLYLRFIADFHDGTFIPQMRKGTSAREPLFNAREVLSEEAFKNYMMWKTMSYVVSLEQHSAQYARDFLKEYPDIRKTQGGEFLENVLIPRTDEYIKISKEKLPKQVILLDEKSPIKSYSELLERLNGDPFLIALWGTWCDPCRYQFRYSDTLSQFLLHHGIEMVYIAFEYDDNREKWKTFIKAYNLTGYHFISNDRFKYDLEKLIGKITRFPTYIIVDSKGKILKSNADFPSNGKELYKQLKYILKL